ncbi:hypothetical protein [Dipodfec virus UOA04_Rod_768]|nr:hypothetical protein [Dipodfec virus UOA04_Rod_768]
MKKKYVYLRSSLTYFLLLSTLLLPSCARSSFAFKGTGEVYYIYSGREMSTPITTIP